MFETLNEIKSAMLKWLDGLFKDLMRNIMLSGVECSLMNASRELGQGCATATTRRRR